MLKRSVILVVAFTLSLFAQADELTIKSSAPETYVVQKGDTLWDISAIYLEQPWLWPKLWRWNTQIDNPHLIYPGDVLRLVYDADGQPMLVMEKPQLKWSPHARKSAKTDAIPTLPLSVIRPYLNFEQAMSAEQIAQLPQVLGSELRARITVEEVKVYVDKPLELAQRYAVYHVGRSFIDPNSEEVLAKQLELVAVGSGLVKGDPDANRPSTLFIDDSRREIRAGDVVLPLQQDQLLPATFTMTQPESDVDAQIIATMTNIREAGTLDVVVINSGANQALKPGNVLSVYRQSPAVVMTSDGPQYLEDTSRLSRLAYEGLDSSMEMPTEKIGEMMIFKVYQDLSFALITRTIRPARLEDKVKL